MSEEAVLHLLMDQLRAQAKEFAWALSFDRSELLKRTYRSSQVAADFKIQTAPYLVDGSGEGEPRAFFVDDRFAVLLGHLGQDPGAPHEARLRHFHRRAAMLQSWLPDHLKDDVYLFLAAPAEPAAAWIDVARIIERDELICRKLVWLAPIEQQDRVASAQRFCSRTFLSRPWMVSPVKANQELDFLTGLPSRWMNALTGNTDSGGDLVEKLLNTFEPESKP